MQMKKKNIYIFYKIPDPRLGMIVYRWIQR